MKALTRKVWNNLELNDPEKDALVLASIKELIPKEQEVLNMSYNKKMKLKEIAAFMQCSVTTVSHHRRRALYKLRAKLNPEYYDEMNRILYSNSHNMLGY